ncbi:very-short-patch-repair endonuclease [Nakamurella sp. UYEF19]|uniref:AAA domain-containing protein n=1 Tax=Nakamurella sp. UYEF19 TaxID=1756392 RepID=UPI00339411E3
MPEQQPDASAGRAQVLNMIDFLSAYDARRNPPVRDIADYRLFRLGDLDLPEHGAVRVRGDENTWLAVDFLDLPAVPVPPDAIARAFVGGSTIDPLVRPELIPAPELPESPEAEISTALIDNAQPTDTAEESGSESSDSPLDEEQAEYQAMAAMARTWIDDIWQPWAAIWTATAAVKKVHRDLFEQRDLLVTDRDSVELVWGFGRLLWRSAGQLVSHPLLTVPVEIDVVPGSEQVRVRPSGAVEVESRFLQGLEIHDRPGFNAIRQAVASDGAEVWLGDDLDDLVRRLVRAVDDEGVVVERTTSATEHAVADLGWSMYLRRRVPDSQGFLDVMRELYRNASQEVPAALRAVMTSEDSETHATFDAESGESGSNPSRPLEPLLLPLPSNEEQERILTTARRHPGVVVQGPPGTGKSHTIANLISHHVAYGRRVLVVAEKEQALKVLADKVPAEIRDLTVSVLGADDEGRRRLESSIMQIQSRVAGVDRAHSDSMIIMLTAELDQIDRGLALTSNQMLRARRAETELLPGEWRAGSNPSPLAAADWTVENAAAYGYIPDALTPGISAPLASELMEFRDLLTAIGAERAHQAGLMLPNPSSLPAASILQNEFKLLADASASVDAVRPMFRDWDSAVRRGPDHINSVVALLHIELEWLQSVEGSWWCQVSTQLRDTLQAREWEGFGAHLERLRTSAMALRTRLRPYDVDAAGAADLVADLTEARDKLRTQGKLGMFAKDAKHAVGLVRVDGQIPTSADGVDLCLAALELGSIRRQIVTLWNNQTGPLQAPALPGIPEEAIAPELAHLAMAAAGDQRWREIVRQLQDMGYDRAGSPTAEGVKAIIRILEQASAHYEKEATAARIAGLRNELRVGAALTNASPLWSLLASDLDTADARSWAAHREEVATLVELGPRAERLRLLRIKFQSLTPLWALEIEKDVAAARDPANLPLAWEWRQLDTWVQGIAAHPEPRELQLKIESLTNDRQRVVTQLVATRAWRRLADNLGYRERQALTAYLKASSRFGKTGGKYAQRWINEMRVALDDAKTAVPVWIMPTAKALSSFRPSAVPPFDVLIIDEASQIGFEALPLLALATSTIVVGDDKQTSPENVGLDREQIFSMMDDFLAQVPKYRTLFDPDNSLYDLASQKFAAPVMLTEHFRCLPEIIAFSNVQAYNGLIIPLRDQPPSPGWSPLGLIRVLDGYRVGDVNEPEAAQVVDLIERLCQDPSYDGMTFGVISLLGSSQSKQIWDLLYERLGPETMELRRIRCGEPANFQGDERDVMVLTTVVAVDPLKPTRIGAMTSNSHLRRINVAASRARNQMWVVTSIDPSQLPNGDLRGELIRHCADPGRLDEVADDLMKKCESDFERRVVNALIARGYRGVEVQNIVGRYRIDIVVSGPDGRLAIECDGDRWHGEDVWNQDRARQQVLERAGWTFERIRGSAFYRDPENAMEPVWRHLEELGIPTGDSWMVERRRSIVQEVSGSSSGTLLLEAPAPETDLSEARASEARLSESPASEAQSPDAMQEQFDRPVRVPARDSIVFEYPTFLTDPAPATSPFVADPPPSGGRHSAPDSVSPRIAETLPPTRLETSYPPATVVDPKPAWVPPSWYRAPDAEEVPESSPAELSSEEPATVERVTPTIPVDAPHTRSGPLAPYRTWARTAMPAVEMVNADAIIDGLVQIVAVEGPMHSDRAYLLYAQAAGKQRVGREMKSTFNRVMARSFVAGELTRLKDTLPDLVDSTIYVPGTPPVVVRELGPRRLYDVPRSEIATLVKLLSFDDLPITELKRAVLDGLGLVRLTDQASAYLDECLKYVWDL